jgi:hypothetical protein
VNGPVFVACLHTRRKKDHDYLEQQVKLKNIAYNTEFDLEIEHCNIDRDGSNMSLRPWSEGERAVSATLCRAVLAAVILLN